MTGDFWVDFNEAYDNWGKTYVYALMMHMNPEYDLPVVKRGKWFLLEDTDGNQCLGKVKSTGFGLIKFELDVASFNLGV